MNKEEIKELFVRTVVLRNGCKASELATVEIIDLVLAGTGYAFTDLVDELVNEGKLGRVKYISSGKESYFLIPIGAQVSFESNKNVCYNCKHHYYNYEQECVVLRNVCNLGDIDSVSGIKTVGICFLKNRDCECRDYELKDA